MSGEFGPQNKKLCNPLRLACGNQGHGACLGNEKGLRSRHLARGRPVNYIPALALKKADNPGEARKEIKNGSD
ncbi:hypothetical protein X474_02630 [Dethiosulfatarculus sandiegensis]|uniref:Uncharacterized protein n=1 Tax=Dethiosulfatarculus sandiegensis TaxID=1429043 RepID=A0A0D2K215_9BACT|nr:hypothetical protein X474_02630 [Dethiosulfatarculus sandiegensis]